MNAFRPKILLIAEAANPEWVSVPLVGWSIAHALREVADVHLVTQIRNRDAVLRAGLKEGQDVTFIDSETVARPLWKLASVLRMGDGKGWTMTTAIGAVSYLYFERLVWQRFGQAIQNNDYDIVHRVTPLSPTASSPIAPRCARANVDFVMGPLNGGVPWPKGFDSERRREQEWLSYIRGVYKLMPGRRRTLRAASAIIAGSKHTASEIPTALQHKVVYLPENAIDPARFNLVAAQDCTVTLRACFIGRMVPYKGPDMLIEAALPLLRDGSLQLDMIGDGPLLDALKNQVAQEGVERAVTFHGWQEHHNVQKIAVRNHILSFPSIREFGGGVVLEAMALGLVPVIVDYAGPGELVDATSGFKIPIGPRPQIISDLRAQLHRLIADPSRLAEMSQTARSKVLKDFTWSAKARHILQVYKTLLETDPTTPLR